MPTARFDLIGLVAEDMAASLAFYRRLGLDIPADADDQPHVEITLPGGLRLAWDTVETIRSFLPDYVHRAGGGASMAFAVDGPADVDTLHDQLVAASYPSEMAPFDAFWGQRYAIVVDPDGNGVDLFAPLAT